MSATVFHVLPQKGQLFAVEMINPNGGRRLICDFRNRHEADAWIVQTERMLHSLDPRHRVVPRSGRQE